MGKRRRRRLVGKQWSEGTVLVLLFVAALLVKYYVQISIGLGVLVVGWLLYSRRKRQKLLRSGIQHVDRMKRRDFEIYLQALFRAHGYSTKVGCNLVFRQKGRKIVLQAKRCNEKVGVSAVEEALASKNEYGADETWVVTNRDYTSSTYRLAALNGVRLINRERLLLLMIQANPQMLRNPTDQEDFIYFHNSRCM